MHNSSLSEVRTAVYVKRLPGNEAAVVRHKEQAGGGDLLRQPQPSQRNTVSVAHVLSRVPAQVSAGVDAPRRHDVDAHVVRCELQRQASRQAD